MANLLTRLHVKNFRSLADVSIDIRPINVLFGPEWVREIDVVGYHLVRKRLHEARR